MKKINIAIDGPAAAGKSTAAKKVAEKLNYIYIDTGAMYRSLTYKALQHQIDVEDEKALTNLLVATTITLLPSDEGQVVLVDGEDVTLKIRERDVTNSVSFVAKHQTVREEMVRRQKEFAEDGGVVMDGRDIGTHVLPNAELKIFLLASVEERALRRHAENLAKGYESDLEQLKAEIAKRDKLDSERAISPLRKADDAIELDTTSMTIEEVVDKMLSLAKAKITE
ncbi:(d)CMP kinase [Heyndrickxia ginsengihumi]|uniref:Cytidylate kinase n=1 Tax=Heyndrickxia ginsengihumi TaxID=363870 RepID=A0A0A6VE04_9BACI|nr:(d)CMP kinase [Heyndrickxia ginsengihumi]KHD85786.1 cytidylate kinase [Heyndrickxia ginsengihumi]MBE6183470.1 (d)CMP kinase [Bacillus sp. (in: firmicutes)]MCM3022909.1 (d)CMP kinase [Heyndrickxia ginsengihumi]NEY20663.1 (d)CMP kinase [Heyndrickxia ginsengihumi]